MIRLEMVSKRYRLHDQTVVAVDVDALEVAAGEYVAIVGSSGSGKTTLLSVLGGMLAPDRGRVLVDGEPLYEASVARRAAARREKIGFVFQTFNLIPYLTALENVQVPLCLGGLTPSEQRGLAAPLLERMGLGDRLHHKPAELSIGQQQRVAMARTLANNPRLILADEPTGNLDPESRQRVLDVFEELHGDGHTILVVTHDGVTAAKARRTLTLSAGQLRESPAVARAA